MQESDQRDFPGGPVVKIPHTRRRGQGADSWSGNQDPAWCGQKLKQNNKASLKKTGARPSIISRGTNPSWVSPLTPSSVQFSRSVMSDSLQPHGLQHARPPCPSPTPGAYSNSCPSSQRCHPTVSSSVVPFSSRLQSFSASESFLRSRRHFASGGQSTGVSAHTPGRRKACSPSNKELPHLSQHSR